MSAASTSVIFMCRKDISVEGSLRKSEARNSKFGFGPTRWATAPSFSCDNLDFAHCQALNGLAPAGLVSGHQQALLSLIANVTQQMQICSRPCSLSAPLRGLI